jgi:diacylglycerol O-acyltransferase / wax synthase
MAETRLLELFPMMPVIGNLTLVVAVLSYAGPLNLTAVADRDGCPDVEVLPRACALPSTTSHDRRLRLPLEGRA